jgi:hypothetical protein
VFESYSRIEGAAAMDEQFKSYFGYWGKAKKDPTQNSPLASCSIVISFY